MTEHIIREQERRASIIDDICQQIVAKADAARANDAAASPRSQASLGALFHSLRPTGFDRLSREDGNAEH